MTYALWEPPLKPDEAAVKAAKVAAIAKAHPELKIGPTGQTFNEAWQMRHRKGLPMQKHLTKPR